MTNDGAVLRLATPRRRSDFPPGFVGEAMQVEGPRPLILRYKRPCRALEEEQLGPRHVKGGPSTGPAPLRGQRRQKMLPPPS